MPLLGQKLAILPRSECVISQRAIAKSLKRSYHPDRFALCHGHDLRIGASKQVGCVANVVSVGRLIVWVGIDTHEVGSGDKCVVRAVDKGSPGLNVVLVYES